MFTSRIRTLAAVAIASIGLAGCSTYDDYYGGYGYGRSYYNSGYTPYRTYAYAPSYYGWYNNYFYPGVGVYLYDQRGSRYRWNSDQQRYWQGWRGERRENWSGYRGDNRNWQGRQWDGNDRRRGNRNGNRNRRR